MPPTAEQFRDELMRMMREGMRNAIGCVDINAGDTRVKAHVTTVSELAEHYRQRELRPDTVWKVI